MTDKTPDTAAANAAKDAEAKTAPAPAKTDDKAKAAAKPKGKAKAAAGSITVIGPKAGFWRAGIRFGAEPQTFEPGDLSPAQIKAIKAEPKLSITNTE
jgi:hypothetical protein